MAALGMAGTVAASIRTSPHESAPCFDFDCILRRQVRWIDMGKGMRRSIRVVPAAQHT